MIAFYLPGGPPVYVFSILMALGMALGLAWSVNVSGFYPGIRPAQPAAERLARRYLAAGLWAGVGALVGGRIAFVLAQPARFQQHPFESWQIYQGGLAWPGALAGGLLAVMLFGILVRFPLLNLLDDLLPLLATQTIAAWLGCWVDGCAYGAATQAFWGLPGRDEWGVVISRLPVQFSGAVLTLVLFWALERKRLRLACRPGTATALALVGLGIQFFFLSLLRADPALLWRGLRLDTWASLGLTLIGVTLWTGLAALRRRRIRPSAWGIRMASPFHQP